MRDIQTIFEIPDGLQSALFNALDPENNPADAELYVYGHHVIATYFEPGVVNLKNLGEAELRKVFNFLCIFHSVGGRIMAGIETPEHRRLLNRVARACSLLLNNLD